MARTQTLPPIGPRPQQARGVEKRRRVYEASLQEFARHGVENARVEDIVAAAEVSWGTFFRYFPRKEDVLLEAAVEEYTTRVVPAVEELLAAGDVPTRQVVETLFGGLTRSSLPPHVHGAMLHEVMNLPTRFAELLGDRDEPVLSLLARVLRTGAERGEVRDDVDPLILASVLAAGTLFPVAQGAYGELPALRELPSRTDPLAVLTQVLGVAWSAIESR
jgi:AcrR family transcriptional regulator